MSADSALDRALPAPYRSRTLDPSRLYALLAHLCSTGAKALGRVDDQSLLAAWNGALEELLDDTSARRVGLDRRLVASSRLSAAGLQAGLEAVGRGQVGAPARELFASAPRRRAHPGARRHDEHATKPALLLLASNLPGLVFQVVLPALAARRPLLVKSASAEPWLAPALLGALTEREPAIGDAMAALSWRGGRSELETTALASCDPVLAYGDSETIAAIRERAGGRVFGFGTGIGLALVASDELETIAAALARDVALFDQRGCLSVHAVITLGDASALGAALAAALGALAEELPPGPIDARTAAAVRLSTDEAIVAGGEVFGDAGRGCVLVDPSGEIRPSPGARTVRVLAIENEAAVPALLAPWRGRIQGMSLAGERAWALEPELRDLAIHRLTQAGRLQLTDASWCNGGVDLLSCLVEP